MTNIRVEEAAKSDKFDEGTKVPEIPTMPVAPKGCSLTVPVCSTSKHPLNMPPLVTKSKVSLNMPPLIAQGKSLSIGKRPATTALEETPNKKHCNVEPSATLCNAASSSEGIPVALSCSKTPSLAVNQGETGLDCKAMTTTSTVLHPTSMSLAIAGAGTSDADFQPKKQWSSQTSVKGALSQSSGEGQRQHGNVQRSKKVRAFVWSNKHRV